MDEEGLRVIRCIVDHMEEIVELKTWMMLDNLSRAAEIWYSFDEEVQFTLWRAESKGGPFTATERKLMENRAFREAYYGS